MPTAAALALAHIRGRATAARPDARARAIGILARATAPADALDRLTAFLRDDARITLNFHPDRVLTSGHTVAEGLLRDGRYLSQFATGISNGSRTAFPGGERDTWERSLFGSAYHGGAVATDERPVYGALDVMQHADGGSPRFGSCYLVLRSHVAARATFTWGDSHAGPEHVGAADVTEPIVAAMLTALEARGSVLGIDDLTVDALVQRLVARTERNLADSPAGRALDDYIEAQVHGGIDLAADVDTIVIDPAFVGTPTGAVLDLLAERHAIHLRKHQGFVLRADEVPSDFRGPVMVPLAHRVIGDHSDTSGLLDAAGLGRAAAAFHRAPAAWASIGAQEEVLQYIKQLWHVLVRFGRAR